MTPHTLTYCPCDPAQPVAYRLADGITRLATRAGSLAWGPLPVDEGRVLEFAQLLAGPWHDWHGSHARGPCRPGLIVEVDLDYGADTLIDWAGEIGWRQGSDGIGCVTRWRVLSPAPTIARAAAGGAFNRTKNMPNRDRAPTAP